MSQQAQPKKTDEDEDEAEFQSFVKNMQKVLETRVAVLLPPPPTEELLVVRQALAAQRSGEENPKNSELWALRMVN